MSKIRLTDHDLKCVVDTFLEIFPSGDSFWIFGSRVYPDKRGGDIDLYIETNIKSAETVVAKKYQYLSVLQNRIGEQKIDLVIKRKNDKMLSIHEVARNEGVKLV